MSEDVTAKLARFSPTGLDRDATLFTTGFAAGKAAGRRTVWKWLAAALAVSNAVTLTVLAWPTPPPPAVVEPAPVRPSLEYLDEPHGLPAPSSYLALTQALDAEAMPEPVAGNSLPSRPLTPRSAADPRFH
jgi:hypothetical protein